MTGSHLEGMIKRTLLALLIALGALPVRAAWSDYPVGPDTFGGNGSLHWSVDLPGTGSSISYKILDNDTCIVSFVLIGTRVTGFGGTLRIKLPEGLQPSRYTFTTAHIEIGDQMSEAAVAVTDDNPYILISPWRGVFDHPTENVNIAGQIMFPVVKK